MNEASHVLPAKPESRSGWPWETIFSGNSETSAPQVWPRITVVTPSYNQGRFIEETIRSVLLQGYPNLEYIIIDGGSTDDSVEIIRKYEPWLAYWVSEKDRGQSHALNKGFECSTGEILAWLCSDDVYTPDALFTAVRNLMGKQRAMVVGASIITDGPDTLEGKPDTRFPSYAEMLYDARTYPQPSIFWTRDLWELSKPIDESLYFVMDYDLWLRMVPQAGQILRTDQVLSIARTHEGQKGADWRENPATAERFSQQRVRSALRAARANKIPLIVWLARSYARRYWLAIRRRNPALLRPSHFHRTALSAVLASFRPSQTIGRPW